MVLVAGLPLSMSVHFPTFSADERGSILVYSGVELVVRRRRLERHQANGANCRQSCNLSHSVFPFIANSRSCSSPSECAPMRHSSRHGHCGKHLSVLHFAGSITQHSARSPRQNDWTMLAMPICRLEGGGAGTEPPNWESRQDGGWAYGRVREGRRRQAARRACRPPGP